MSEYEGKLDPTDDELAAMTRDEQIAWLEQSMAAGIKRALGDPKVPWSDAAHNAIAAEIQAVSARFPPVPARVTVTFGGKKIECVPWEYEPINFPCVMPVDDLADEIADMLHGHVDPRDVHSLATTIANTLDANSWIAETGDEDDELDYSPPEQTWWGNPTEGELLQVAKQVAEIGEKPGPLHVQPWAMKKLADVGVIKLTREQRADLIDRWHGQWPEIKKCDVPVAVANEHIATGAHLDRLCKMVSNSVRRKSGETDAELRERVQVEIDQQAIEAQVRYNWNPSDLPEPARSNAIRAIGVDTGRMPTARDPVSCAELSCGICPRCRAYKGE